MRTIWIYREMRSGSTALSQEIATRLQRKHILVNSDNKLNFLLRLPNPQDFVFSTHDFSILERMQEYSTKPMLIRSTRRNKTEQILSYIFLKWKNKSLPPDKQFQNITDPDQDTTKIFSGMSPRNISHTEVLNALYHYNNNRILWNNYAPNFFNRVVHYEDLCSPGVSMPEINIDSIRVDDSSVTKKIPPYKEKLFLNISEIEGWVEDFMSSPPTTLAVMS